MNKFLLVATYCITLFYTAHAQYQTHWGKSITSSDDFRITDMCVDNSGNVYTIGTFDGTMDLDPGPGVYNITGPLNISRSHVFLQKLDASGNFVWGKLIPMNDAPSFRTNIAVDNQQNVYCSGNFAGTVDFDLGPGVHYLTQRSNYRDQFLLKLNANGDFVWVKQWGATGVFGAYGSQLTVNNDGNIQLLGQFVGTIDLDPGAGVSNFTSTSLNNSSIVSLNSNGDFLWARYLPTFARSITHTSTNELLIAGHFTGTVDFDLGAGVHNVTAGGTQDGYVLKLTNSGDFVSVGTFVGNIYPRKIAVDINDNTLVCGYFNDAVDLDPSASVHNLTTTATSAFIVKLNASGGFMWGKKPDSPNPTDGSFVTTDNSGNVYMVGGMGDSTAFNPGISPAIFTNSSSSDAYIVRFLPDGTINSAMGFGSSTSDACFGASVHKATGDLYVNGTFTNTMNIDFSGGNMPLVTSSRACFTLKISPECNPVNGTDTRSECAPFIWIDGNTYSTSNTTATHTITGGAVNGCDSIVTLNLTINQPTASSTTITDCGQYTWAANNQTYTTSGTYTHVIPNANNCDSTITLNLTINQPTASSITITDCGQYTWAANNQTYTTSGTYTHVIPNANNCDSTITLNLTINQPTSSSTTVTECGQYTWAANNQTYTTSGTYTHVIPNANNCDSTITLNLTINQPTSSSTTITDCGQYTWAANNQTYTTSGTYTHVIPNVNNCDSTITLNLTINQPTSSTLTQTACGSYTLNGQTYTISGIYTQVISNAANCDSTITLNLTINNVNTTVTASGIVLTATQSGATYQWIDCDNNDAPIAGATGQSFTSTQNGNYAVTITANGCTETSDCMPVNSVGIETLEQNGWSVYPNPGNGMFTLKGTISGNPQISVMNVLGQVINAPISTSGETISLDLTTEPAGMYLVKIELSNQSHIIQVIKK